MNDRRPKIHTEDAAPVAPLTLAQQRAHLVGADAIAFIRELMRAAPDLTEAQRATVRAAFAPARAPSCGAADTRPGFSAAPVAITGQE